MQLVRLAFLTLAAAAASFAAEIDGKWTGELSTQNGTMQLTMNLKADGETLTGTIGTQMGDMPIKRGRSRATNSPGSPSLKATATPCAS